MNFFLYFGLGWAGLDWTGINGGSGRVKYGLVFHLTILNTLLGARALGRSAVLLLDMVCLVGPFWE
jgi:hypothetical protein